MTSGVKTILYPVDDVDTARAIFTALLGEGPQTDQPYYVGWRAAGQDIGLVPNGQRQGMTGPEPYWFVDDMHQRIEALKSAGCQVRQDPRDVGGGRLVAKLIDPEGNPIGLIQDP